MIKQLTPDQINKLSEYRERGIKMGLDCSPFDRKAAEAYSKKIQTFLKRPIGPTIIMPGPIQAWLATTMLNQVGDQIGIQVLEQVRDQVGNKVENQVLDQVGNKVGIQVLNQVGIQIRNQVEIQVVYQVEDQVWNQVRNQVVSQVWSQVVNQVGSQVESQVRNQVASQVGDQVRSQVESQARNQVANQVRDQVENQVRNQVRNQVWDQVRDFIWPWLDGHWYSHFVVWANYFRDVLGLTLSDYSIMSDSMPFDLIYPLSNGAVIYSEKPLFIHRNRNNLHCDGGPAWAYRDETKGWALNGVRVPQKLAETKAEELDCKKWISERNAEVRREFVRKVGVERLVVKLGAKVLDKQGDYELLMIDLKGETGEWPALKMLNPSINVWHVEWVDKSCKTVEQALKWRNHGEAYPGVLT